MASSHRRQRNLKRSPLARLCQEKAQRVAQASVDTSNSSSARSISTDRLRDYVGAFVLAGLDPRVGAEADFFADQVQGPTTRAS